MNLKDEAARVLRTAGYSLDGWRFAWREEKSLRQWAGINLAGWIALLVLRPSLMACAVIVITGALLLAFELVNSAIEATIDYISTEHHPLAKVAKDTGSAAVAVTGLAYIAVWVFALAELWG